MFLTLKDQESFPENGSFLTGFQNYMNWHLDAVICNFLLNASTFYSKFPHKPWSGNEHKGIIDRILSNWGMEINNLELRGCWERLY